MNEIGNNENNIEKENLIYEYLKNKDIIKILEINKNPGSTDDYYNFINYEDNIDDNIISTNIGNIYEMSEYNFSFNNNLFILDFSYCDSLRKENESENEDKKVDIKKDNEKKKDDKKGNDKQENVQKPGRKKNNVNKYSQIHSKFNSDNIRVKIKCHYNNFIIDFFNKLIKKKFKKQIYKFRKISYDISKNVSKSYNKILLNKKIQEILTMEISGKYKNINKVQNINTFNKSKFLKLEYSELLEMTYEEFYQKIYLPDNNDDEIKIKYDLDKNSINGNLKQILHRLEKKNQLNDEYKNKIMNVAKKEFIEYFMSNKNLNYK